jgi:endonuclease/exonuclease/phosphatase family metal-dependent hydrolase
VPLKLACLNLEGSKHLPAAEAFLRATQPDVLCLQELYQADLPLFEDLMGQPLLFAPMTRREPGQVLGLGLGARGTLTQPACHYYKGDGRAVPTFRRYAGTPLVDTASLHHALLAATVGGLRIATTHLTWTPDGHPTPEQLADADRLLALAQAEAQTHGGLVLCGDFNAPRGLPTFAKLAAAFSDAIPAHYTTSLDLTLHRVRHNPVEAARVATYMVDGLFHTPDYRVSEVTFTGGISDHMALTAMLDRA